MAFILDSHIPHDNTVCPRLATLSFCMTTLPGDVLVQVLQSRAPLTGMGRAMFTVCDIWECGGVLAHHRMELDAIAEACGSHFAFRYQIFWKYMILHIQNCIGQSYRCILVGCY